ncbi:MAG: HNH endonuclease [Pigmentiphaga sp.]
MTELSRDIVRELLHYNPGTGAFTWRHRGLHWFKSEADCRKWNSKLAGKPAGCTYTTKRGYQRSSLRLLGKLYGTHQIAFMYMEGRMVECVDHINRNAADNAWINLRAADVRENNLNASINANNTSGYTGVYWDKGRNAYQARVYENYKCIHLGRFETAELAHQAVVAKRKALGYSPGHGEKRPY